MFLINLFQIMQVVRTFRIDTFVNDEVLTVLLGNKGIATMRTAEFGGRKLIFVWRKFCVTYFAKHLSLGSIVFIEKYFRGATTRADAFIRNITIGAARDWFDFFPVTFFEVRNQVFVGPILFKISDEW